MRSHGLRRLVDDKFVGCCPQTCCKLIIKTCYPQACYKLFQQVEASLAANDKQTCWNLMNLTNLLHNKPVILTGCNTFVTFSSAVKVVYSKAHENIGSFTTSLFK